MRGLGAKGFEVDELFGGDRCVTSGEIVYQSLKTPRRTAAFSRLGGNCVHITWMKRGSGGISLETATTGVRAVGRAVDEADFVLIHGTEAVGRSVGGGGEEELEELPAAELMDLLRACAERNLPMIVANPDVFTVDGDELAVMPGWYAGQYGKMGGSFALMGKPNRIIFDAALELHRERAGAAPAGSRVLVVGDSLVHDISGGANSGLDTLFITTGIHRREIFGADGGGAEGPGDDDDDAVGGRIVELCRELECPLPTYFMKALVY